MKYSYTETIELNDSEFGLLERCRDQKYLEYRDPQYKTLEEFRENDPELLESKPLDYFSNRNEGGTYDIAKKLLLLDLIEDNIDSWHMTFVLSEKGKKFLNKYTRRLILPVGTSTPQKAKQTILELMEAYKEEIELKENNENK